MRWDYKVEHNRDDDARVAVEAHESARVKRAMLKDVKAFGRMAN